MKKENAITLIALIISIIILLILTVVTISATIGNNGILNQAVNATDKNIKEKNLEEIQIAKSELLINYYNSNNTNFNNQIKLSTGNSLFIDKNGDFAIIPNGFTVSEFNDENTIKNGLVIYQTNNNQKIEWTENNKNIIQETYNQFVWIPVEKSENYVRNTTYRDEEISKTACTDTYYLPKKIQPKIDTSNNNEKAEKESILDIGGFYIARYETGIEKNTIVSKKNQFVFNNISQEEAKKLSKTMIISDNAQTALCSGIQWDVTMNFVNNKLDGTLDIFNVTSVSYNRHTELDIPAYTGQNEADKVCNIYDLEGNCLEYIAEKNSYDEINNPYIGRGGSTNDHTFASNRYGLNGSAKDLRSFRLVMYILYF